MSGRASPLDSHEPARSNSQAVRGQFSSLERCQRAVDRNLRLCRV